MASIFAKIINKELPGYILAEDSNFIAFLDISPLTFGHALVVPKQEIDYIFDIKDDVLGSMMQFSKKVALAIEKVVPCKRIGMAVIGLEVPHAHIHLVPLNSVSDINFSLPKKSFPHEEMEKLTKEIKSFL